MKTPTLPLGLNVRPSTPADAPFLEALHCSTRQDLQFIDAEQGFIDTLISMQHDAQTNSYGEQFPNAMYWIIERHHQRIGKATLDFDSNVVHLIDLAFIPEARGKGYGKVVLETFQQTAKQVNAPMLLTVMQDNTDAKNLYLRLGFVVESMSPPYERMIWYPPTERIMVGA